MMESFPRFRTYADPVMRYLRAIFTIPGRDGRILRDADRNTGASYGANMASKRQTGTLWIRKMADILYYSRLRVIPQFVTLEGRVRIDD